MSIGEMPSWLKRLNEWLTLFVTIVGVLTIIAGTEWLEATRSWIYANAPGAIATTIRSVGWVVHSIIEPYRQAMSWVFGFLPIDIPEWLEAGLPPIFMILGNACVAGLMRLIASRRSAAIGREREGSEKFVKRLGEQTEILLNDNSLTMPDQALKDAYKLDKIAERDRLRTAIESLRVQRDKFQRISITWSLRAALISVAFGIIFLMEWLYLAFLR